MSSPKISIVIPSYNKVNYIEATLRSVFFQNYSNFEVLVQDGGSTDGTLEIVKKYANKYPGALKWTSGKDRGQVDAINKGLKKASGGILTYINADDIYKPGAFFEVIEAYKKNPESLWFAGYGDVINGKGVEIVKLISLYKNLLLILNSYFLLLTLNYLNQPSVFISRKALEKYGPFGGNNSYVLEYDFWLKLGKIKMPIVINKTLSSFRISADNISSVSYKNLLNDEFRIVRKYTNNPLILFLHWLNNLGRVGVIKLLNG